MSNPFKAHLQSNIIYSFSLLVRVRYIVKNALCPSFYVSCVNKLYYTKDGQPSQRLYVRGQYLEQCVTTMGGDQSVRASQKVLGNVNVDEILLQPK